MPRFEGIPNRFRDEPADRTFPVEFHFPLGGVDIDINGRGIDLEEKAANRIAALHERGVVAFHQGEIQPAIFHRALIDEQMLVVTSRPGDARCADPTPYPDFSGGRDFSRSFRSFGSQTDRFKASRRIDRHP